MATAYGVYPEAHTVEARGEGRELVVRNRFYEVTHSLAHGGAISAVRLLKVSDENLLLAPMDAELRLADAPHPFALDATARVEQPAGTATIVAEGPLRDRDGKDCGATLRVTYEHRWGYIKVRQEWRFPAGGLEVRTLTAQRWRVIPALTHYGLRPGAAAEVSSWTGHFGVCQWGHFTPGRAFDCAVESRHVPRYLCVAEPGRRGLEWFVGSQLAQWDYQTTGSPGHGCLWLGQQASPLAVAWHACPLDLPRGSRRLSGTLVFDSYIGIPIISGAAHQPYLHTSFNRHAWPTAETVAGWAARGIRTAHFHHDGDSFDDGLFWRDGRYPPFEPADMREYDRVIAECHRHGIRVATYFSNKELHPSTAAYQAHGAEWARLPDDRGEQLHNRYKSDEFGAQMCLRSGWLDFHKEYIDTVLKHHALDGTYFDWNVALYCHNVAHVRGGAPVPPGMGDWALSPAGHWDMDELLDLVEWTRRRVGPEGMMIIHNTMVPMAAIENFADHIVAMEWGYAQLATGAPALDELPLEWQFMGARPRGVIGYGCLAKDTPEAVHRQMNVRCLLSGTAPWPALELDTEMFAPLRGLDLRGYRFRDWRTPVATTAAPGVATASYVRPGELLLLAGEFHGHARRVSLVVPLAEAGLGAAGTPAGAARYRVSLVGGRERVVTAQPDGTLRLPIALPANGVTLVRVTAA